jgi:hypothetical protein
LQNKAAVGEREWPVKEAVLEDFRIGGLEQVDRQKAQGGRLNAIGKAEVFRKQLE